MGNNEIISITQASCLLDITNTTLRNWTRNGLISPIENTKSKFLYNDISALKNKIENGEINRLNKRANKKKTGKTILPSEYINDKSFIVQIEEIMSVFVRKKLNLGLTIFVLVLKQLSTKKEFSIISIENIFKIASFSNWRRPCIKREIFNRAEELGLNENQSVDGYKDIFVLLDNFSHDDTLGIIYQSLLDIGKKSRKGSYYTPKVLIDGIFDYSDKNNESFLDPCCGTGQFILSAINSGYKNPENIYGYDIDSTAAHIARVNLMLSFKDKDFTPKIQTANTLGKNTFLNHPEKGFSMIATNPPWGGYVEKAFLNNYKKNEVFSGESFSLFIAKSLQFSKKGGCLTFILPESFLNIRIHSNIRRYILNNTVIDSIHSLGRQFNAVFTPVIRIDLINKKPDEKSFVSVFDNKTYLYKINQKRFMKNENNIIDVNLSEEDECLITKIYSTPHITLKNNADWAIGVVTGNNKKHILEKYEMESEPIYKGSDVLNFRLKSPSHYIKFIPELYQQVAQENKYRAKEKLIYKFISRRLVFAYDSEKSLTLNSANILIPKFENYSMKVILAFLNSKLFTYLFKKKYNTYKILRGDLEQLPLPILDNEVIESIETFVDMQINGKNVSDMIDDLVYESFSLTTKEIDIINNFYKK